MASFIALKHSSTSWVFFAFLCKNYNWSANFLRSYMSIAYLNESNISCLFSCFIAFDSSDMPPFFGIAFELWAVIGYLEVNPSCSISNDYVSVETLGLFLAPKAHRTRGTFFSPVFKGSLRSYYLWSSCWSGRFFGFTIVLSSRLDSNFGAKVIGLPGSIVWW